MLSSETSDYNHHNIFARLAETMALLHFDLSKTANDEQAEAKRRKQTAHEAHIATFNSFVSVIAQMANAAIPALGAVHMGFTGAASSSIFELAGSIHNPLHSIVGTHIEGKQTLHEQTAGLHGDYANELGEAMGKTDQFVQKMLDVHKTIQENHWRTLQEAARSAAH